jgi:hypothetical protein
MPNLLNFRDYDEHDVVNLFAYSGTLPVNKGTIVKIVGNGWKNTDELDMLGSPGNAYDNTVAERYGVAAKVGDAASGEAGLGILLYDVKETDENGEKLIFNPKKAAEMGVAISGQAVPVATRGTFLYDGVVGTPVAGASAYWDGSEISAVTGANVIGKFLGAKDADDNVLVKIDL